MEVQMKKGLIVALILLLVGVTAWGALDKADYKGGVYWTDRHNAVLAGIESTGILDLIGGAEFDNTTASTLTITETNITLVGAFSVTGSSALYGAAIGIGYDVGAAMSIATTDTTGVMAITHAGSGPTMAWTIPEWAFTNSTSMTCYTPSWVLGYDAGAAMTIAVTDTTGNVAITHAGSNKSVTWTASGGFDFVGAIALDGITQVGNVSMDGTTMLFDGSTSVRGVSAGFAILESPANRFGLNATEYMQIATTVTSGDTAITHTGATPDVTWAADSLTFTGTFEVVGASTFDAITGVGNLDIDGTTILIDGSTSVRGVSAGFASLESPANRFGSDASIYMQIATTATTGVTAITHTGSGATVTWTADSFDFVGPISLDATTFSSTLITGNGNGAIVADKITVVEYMGEVHKSTFTFTLTGANDLDLADGDHGTGVKVYDLPEGRILILGATINGVVVTSANYNASPNDVFVVSMGTVVGADDNALTGTEADIIPSTELDTVGASALTLNWHEALTASTQFDGTSTPIDIYVNAACTDASNTGANTYAVTGTCTLMWINLGDY